MKNFKLLILLTLILSETHLFSQKFNLKLNLEKGKTYKQISHQEVVTEQDFMGQSIIVTITITGEMEYFVKDIIDDNYNMDVKFVRLGTVIESPEGKMEFNSDMPTEDDIFSMLLSKFVGKTFSMEITKKGKIPKITGINEIIDEQINQLSGLLPKENLENLRKHLDESYGEIALKKNFEHMNDVYPENLISINDEWVIQTELNSVMPGVLTTTYQLLEANPDYYIIQGNGIIKTNNSPSKLKAGEMNLVYDLTGIMNSQIQLDAKSGWVHEMKVTQDMDGFIVYLMEDGEEMKVPATIKGNHKMADY